MVRPFSNLITSSQVDYRYCLPRGTAKRAILSGELLSATASSALLLDCVDAARKWGPKGGRPLEIGERLLSRRAITRKYGLSLIYVTKCISEGVIPAVERIGRFGKTALYVHPEQAESLWHEHALRLAQ